MVAALRDEMIWNGLYGLYSIRQLGLILRLFDAVEAGSLKARGLSTWWQMEWETSERK